MEQQDRRNAAAGLESTNSAQAWTSAQRQFSEIQNNLMRSQTDAYAALQKQLYEAQRNHAAAISNLHEELSSKYREAQEHYLVRVLEAASSAAAATNTQETWSGFQQTATGMKEEFSTRAEQSYKEMVSAVEAAGRAYESTIRDAYRESLRSQRDFWLKLDVDSLVPSY